MSLVVGVHTGIDFLQLVIGSWPTGSAGVLFADLNRSLAPMLAGTDLSPGEREPFPGGLYTVTIARPGPAE